MSNGALSISLAFGLSLITVVPVAAQGWFLPGYALPSSNGTPATWVMGSYGRSINDDSGKINTFAGGIGRTTQRASFAGMAGYADDAEEWTVGAAVGVDLTSGNST